MFTRCLILCVATYVGPAFAQTALPAAQVGSPYKVQLGAAVSGVYPFTFATTDTLPDGITLSRTGMLTGTANAESRGPVTFSVEITDATNAKMGTFPFSIVIAKDPPVQVVIGQAAKPNPTTPEQKQTAALRQVASTAPHQQASDPPAAAAAATPAPGADPPPQSSPSPTPTPAPPGIVPANPRIAPGGSVLFTAQGLQPPLAWGFQVADSSASPGAGELRRGNRQVDPGKRPNNNGRAEEESDQYRIDAVPPNQARLFVSEAAVVPQTGRITVYACNSTKTAAGSATCNNTVATAGVDVQLVKRPPGLIVIPVIGFQQVGASAAASTQKFFFDLFVSRPLPLFQRHWDDCAKDDDCRFFGPKLRLWGDVRIGSYPQQITSGVGQFATGFATQVAQLKVNQLAQAGEFSVGLEYRRLSFHWPFSSVESEDSQRVSLSWVTGFGATSPFNPVETLQIFQNPASGSPQAAAFFKAFPSSQGFTFTGFTTPNRDRFFWEYGAGVRMTIPFYDRSNLQIGSPAMLTYMLGQNQLVSGGISRGVVQRVEGFYPLPLGSRMMRDMVLYLFGRADMRLAGGNQTVPFILQPAPAGVNGFDPNVNIVAPRSNRDLYTIGVGIDAVSLIKAITLQNPSATAKTPAGGNK